MSLRRSSSRLATFLCVSRVGYGFAPYQAVALYQTAKILTAHPAENAAVTQSRVAMDVMRPGSSSSLFQASQAASRMAE